MDEALFATLPPLLAFSLIRTASQVTVLKLLVSQRDVSASMSTCPIIAILTDTVKHEMLSNLLRLYPRNTMTRIPTIATIDPLMRFKRCFSCKNNPAIRTVISTSRRFTDIT